MKAIAARLVKPTAAVAKRGDVATSDLNTTLQHGRTSVNAS
jgi:hypothetical protein